MRTHLALALLILMPACTQFPALDRSVTPALEAAEFPQLVPLEPVLASASAPRSDAAAIDRQLAGRVSALRARAARLRGSVLTGAERVRLRNGLR